MSVNNVNGAQPKLYTFAEMGYVTQAPQAQAPAAPAAQANGDVADLSTAKPKKKVSKGVIVAIATVAVAALAAFGLAKSGKKYTGSEKLFTLQNFAEGFTNLRCFVTSIPSRISGLIHRDGGGTHADGISEDIFDAGAEIADSLSRAAEEAARGEIIK